MADSYTPNFNMTLVEVGASRDTWGSKLNANTSTLDQAVGMAMPVGAILDFAGPNAPPGWLICDGRLISRITYSALFAVIATYWGAGDGSTTFALPATPGRALVGPGSFTDDIGGTYAYGFTGKAGALFRAIAQTHLPAISLTSNTVAAHAHAGLTMPGGNHAHGMDSAGYHGHGMDAQGSHKHGVWSNPAGDHLHYVNIRQSGTGVAGGASPVDSPLFGDRTVNTDTQGSHTHPIDMDYQGSHQHAIYGDGYHAHAIQYSGNFQLGIYPDGSHAHSVSLGGSGTALAIQNPLLVCTKIIYAGSQAASTALAAPAGTSVRRLSAPLRGGMRRLAA